jgi:calnexin
MALKRAFGSKDAEGEDIWILSLAQVHLILRHKSPKTGEIEEKHLQNPPMVESDKATHVYTVILKPDNT